MKITYRSSPAQFQMALLHMLGQMEDMHMAVTTADVAAWCGVTKQTAKKYLDRLYDNFHLNRFDDPYHTHFTRHLWELSIDPKKRYRNGEFCNAYLMFMEQKWSL